jgi:hypothetical protein
VAVLVTSDDNSNSFWFIYKVKEAKHDMAVSHHLLKSLWANEAVFQPLDVRILVKIMLRKVLKMKVKKVHFDDSYKKSILENGDILYTTDYIIKNKNAPFWRRTLVFFLILVVLVVSIVSKIKFDSYEEKQIAFYITAILILVPSFINMLIQFFRPLSIRLSAMSILINGNIATFNFEEFVSGSSHLIEDLVDFLSPKIVDKFQPSISSKSILEEKLIKIELDKVYVISKTDYNHVLGTQLVDYAIFLPVLPRMLVIDFLKLTNAKTIDDKETYVPSIAENFATYD